jgi:hypothetical protein
VHPAYPFAGRPCDARPVPIFEGSFRTDLGLVFLIDEHKVYDVKDQRAKMMTVDAADLTKGTTTGGRHFLPAVRWVTPCCRIHN